MAVIILHPTEELKLINFQKELISDLFTEGRILVAARPLWIPVVETFEKLNHSNISSVEFGDLENTESEIYIPVKIATTNGNKSSKLSLVSIYNNSNFTEKDRQIISQKKQPVRQLKIFRLGNEKELSSISKCITDFKWIKIK